MTPAQHQEKSFSLSASENGVEVTLTVDLSPAMSASFAPLAGLDDCESPEVCKQTFAASVKSLADLTYRALDEALGHAQQAHAAIVSYRSALAPTDSDNADQE